MNYLRSLRRLRRNRSLGLTLVFTIVGWALGLPLLLTTTSAAQLTQVSATASSSAPSVSTDYAVQFTTANTIGDTASGFSSTTRITFDPTGNAFAFASLATSTTDIVIARTGGGLTQVTQLSSCGAPANEIYVDRIDNTSHYVEFRTCNTDTIAAGTITVTFRNARVTNPAATGSYVVRINGTMFDSGDTRVAITNVVTVTAFVDTNLTFSISGVASNTPVNGVTTSTTTVPSATAIGFGYLSAGTSSIAAQQLSVSTNAANGYSVTVTQNQNLTSVSGADIDTFKDGNAVSDTVPAPWTTPTKTIGIENTYGHFGLTTDDNTLLGGADTYGTALFAGLTSTSTRLVMYNTGPADGTTQNVGLAKVAYRVEITELQEAATDYTNQLTYVCTPVF